MGSRACSTCSLSPLAHNYRYLPASDLIIAGDGSHLRMGRRKGDWDSCSSLLDNFARRRWRSINVGPHSKQYLHCRWSAFPDLSIDEPPLKFLSPSVFQHRSAEVIAVNNCVRYTFSAAASAFVLPMIVRTIDWLSCFWTLTSASTPQQQVGIGWTNTFSAGLVWIGFALILLVIRYGETLRNTGERWEGKEKPADPA